MDMNMLEEKLRSQLQLYEQLRRLLEEETGALVRKKLDDMENITGQKNQLSEDIQEADASLRRIVSLLATERGFAPEVPLATIVASMGKQKISLLCRRLAETWQRIQDVSSLNGAISSQFIRTAQLAQESLCKLINNSNMYGASGGYVWRNSGSIMINKEA